MSSTVDERDRRIKPGPAIRKPTPIPAPAAAALAHVLLVDARAERLAVMRALLQGGTLATVVGEADSRSSAVELAGTTGADLVIVEIQMPVEEGLAVVAALRRQYPLLRIVVCSFHHDAATQQRATDNGADAYLSKPVDVRALGRLLQFYADNRRPAMPGS